MTALDFYKKRLKDRGFNESQIKELTEHRDLPWIKFAEDYIETISVTRCSIQLPDGDKRKEIEENAYFLNLQNLTGREDFEEAFRLGIMTGVDETIEYLENKAIV